MRGRPSRAASELATTATRGVMWTGGAQLAKQAIQIATSVALARLLVPEDFGLLGMALVFVGIAQLFVDFGVGAAIVQRKSISDVALSSCFWLNIGVAGALAMVMVLASPLIGAFYRNPAVGHVVAVSSLSMVLSGAAVVPQSILYRALRFPAIAKAQVLGTVTGSLIALALALAGAGVWSLVAQPLAGTLAVVVALFASSRWWPGLRFAWSEIIGLVRFSAGVLGATLINYANRNADNLLIGRFLGSGALGYYALSYQMMLYPLQQVTSAVVRVLFPTLSQLADDETRFRDAYLKSVGAIAVITFPMMAGLFVVADDFVYVVLGEKWLAIVPLIRILSWVGMLQSVGTTVGTLYLSTGSVRTLFNVTLASTPILIGGVAAGLAWGVTGVAAGYALAVLLLFYPTLAIAFRVARLRVSDFFRVAMPPFACALVMLSVVAAARIGLDGMAAEWRLTLLVMLGMATYATASWLFNRRQVIELVRIAVSALGARRRA